MFLWKEKNYEITTRNDDGGSLDPAFRFRFCRHGNRQYNDRFRHYDRNNGYHNHFTEHHGIAEYNRISQYSGRLDQSSTEHSGQHERFCRYGHKRVSHWHDIRHDSLRHRNRQHRDQWNCHGIARHCDRDSRDRYGEWMRAWRPRTSSRPWIKTAMEKSAPMNSPKVQRA